MRKKSNSTNITPQQTKKECTGNARKITLHNKNNN